jgi:hypothetical protein
MNKIKNIHTHEIKTFIITLHIQPFS